MIVGSEEAVVLIVYRVVVCSNFIGFFYKFLMLVEASYLHGFKRVTLG